MEIVALSHSVSQSQSYAVVLGELAGRPRRKLPIVIGASEAQAIAVAIEKITPTRPLTHDLVRNIFDMISLELREVVIDNLQDGIFYSKLVCVSAGREIEIDSRTSDALALAVRFNCPIYTYDFILEQAAIILEDDDSSSAQESSEALSPKVEGRSERSSSAPLSEFSLQELNDKLKELLEKEDYERAIRIRDELDKRKRENS